jgi:hypothetical protein
MVIQLKSDLHMELGTYTPVCREGDVLVLAGDINRSAAGLEWAMDNYPGMQIVFVPGNHEFHGQNATSVMCELDHVAGRDHGIHVLQNRSVVIGNVRFIGATLWSDFNLLGASQFNAACTQALQGFSGARKITAGLNGARRKVAIAEVIDWHKIHLRFLGHALAQPFPGKTVVVTHYAPSLHSLPAKKQHLPKGCRDASNLEWLIGKYKPDYWLHGHTHHNVDYQLDQTRILTNQRGYYPEKLVRDFKEDLLIAL